MVELQGCFGLIVGSASQVIPQLDNFAGNNLNFETERLRLRPFEDADLDLALPFYGDPDFLIAMEGNLPTNPSQRRLSQTCRQGYGKTGLPVCKSRKGE